MPRLPLPLPRLTLYTGGKECSLCEVGPQPASRVQRRVQLTATGRKAAARSPQKDTPVRPHTLQHPRTTARRRPARGKKVEETLPVRYPCSPPGGQAGPEAQDRQRNTRKGARGMEGAKAEGAGGDERDGRGKQAVEHHQVKKRFEAYRSVLRFPSLQITQDTTPTCNQMPPDPPWRTPLGRTFFHLPSPVGEYTQHESNKAEGESAKGSSYTDILKRTFKDFSDVSVGSDVEIVHLHRQYPPKAAAAAEEELEEGELEQDDWTVDIEPMRGYVEDDSNSIIFDDDDDGEPPNEPADLPSFHGQVIHVLPFTRNS